MGCDFYLNPPPDNTFTNETTGRKRSSYHLEHMVDTYWGSVIQNKYSLMLDIYNLCLKLKLNSKNKYYFNDGDDSIWRVPSDGSRVFIHTSQNLNLIFVLPLEDKLSAFTGIHIRRYWDDLKPPAKKDKLGTKFFLNDENEFKKRVYKYGRRAALAEKFLQEQYSDVVPECYYPERPNFNHFKKADFKPRYGDFRDIGYVASYYNGLVAGSMSKHGILKIIFECYLSNILSSLKT